MIGNTVETDLVGELCEVYQRSIPMPLRIARGRVRAVTAAKDGYLLLWLEIIDHEGVGEANIRLAHSIHELGDIICIAASTYDWDASSCYIRLVKS